MRRAYAALLIFGGVLAKADRAVAQWSWPAPEQSVYALYREAMIPDTRVHIATFDAAYGERYNRENCERARFLFVSQPGVIVRYWCERGRFDPHKGP
jgi:hypothetical protein